MGGGRGPPPPVAAQAASPPGPPKKNLRAPGGLLVVLAASGTWSSIGRAGQLPLLLRFAALLEHRALLGQLLGNPGL
eukprot:1696334-Pyramimonas_sp.AAC.1